MSDTKDQNLSWKTFNCSSGGFTETGVPPGEQRWGRLPLSAVFIATRADRETFSVQLKIMLR